MGAWIKQIASQVAKHGEKAASWYTEWNEPDGTRRCKSCGAGSKGKKLAQALADKLNAELTLGQYTTDRKSRTTWDDFVSRYKEVTLTQISAVGLKEAETSLKHFGRILGLEGRPMTRINTERVDEFKAARRAEAGKKPGSKVSPATVNKDLRHIKAALNVAVEWKFLKEMPKIKFLREPERLPTYILPEHFAAIYQACDVAQFPNDFAAGARTWWRGLLIFCQMTGWRIGETLALKWADVDLKAARAVTRAKSNKGKRDTLVPLHSVVIDHLKEMQTFHTNVFPWELHRRTLDVEFARIQDAAKINLPCKVTGRRKGEPYVVGDEHACTDACHRYGFHDERRAFATLNAPNMTREALKVLMRHASEQTAAKYINMAKQLNPAVVTLVVPDLKVKTTEAEAG